MDLFWKLSRHLGLSRIADRKLVRSTNVNTRLFAMSAVVNRLGILRDFPSRVAAFVPEQKVLQATLADVDRRIQYVAAAALGKFFGDESAWEILAKVLKDNEFPRGVTGIESSFERDHYVTSAIAQIGEQRTCELLKRLALDPKRELGIRVSCIHQIGHCKKCDSAAALICIYSECGDVHLRGTAMSAMRSAKNSVVCDAIIDSLKSSNIDERAEAALTLGTFGDARAISELTSQLSRKTKTNYVIYDFSKFAWALRRAAGEKAVDPLLKYAREGENRYHALEVLKSIAQDHPSVLPRIAPLIDSFEALPKPGDVCPSCEGRKRIRGSTLDGTTKFSVCPLCNGWGVVLSENDIIRRTTRGV